MAELETKEVAIVKQQATKAVTMAESLVITNDTELASATDILSKVKKLGKMIKERKEEITRPLMDSLNSVRDLFKPIEQSHAEAERIIKSKMLAYQEEQERIRAAEEAKIAKSLESNRIKPETAIKKMENLPEVQTSMKGSVGAISTRIVKKVRITDETKIPREYLTPNMPLINEAALKQGKEIPGIEVYEEKVIAAR